MLDFPILNLDDIRDLTVGTYQLKLAPSYVQDNVQEDNDRVFQFDERIIEEGFVRFRMYSRFRRNTVYQQWIAYRFDGEDDEDDEENHGENPILGYYCTCKCGARTLGSCSHIAALCWFLGYARLQERVKYPSTNLLNTIFNAHQPNHNHDDEIPLIVDN